MNVGRLMENAFIENIYLYLLFLIIFLPKIKERSQYENNPAEFYQNGGCTDDYSPFNPPVTGVDVSTQ